MRPDRKKKLKLRAEKAERSDARKHASLERTLAVFGLKEVISRFPKGIRDLFVEKMGPGVEVVASEDSRDDPEISEVVREIQALTKRPLRSSIEGREFELAIDDFYRCMISIVDGIDFYFANYRNDPRPEYRESYLLMEEAKWL